MPGLIRQDILRQHPFFCSSIYTLRRQSDFAFFILDFFEFFRVGFLSVSCSFQIFSTRQRFLWLSTTNCLKCWDGKTCTIDGHDYQQPDIATQMMVMITWDGTHRTHRMLCRTICSSMYIHRLHIHTPRPAERERNEGSLEAMVSMEHAARRRGDPWIRNGAGPGAA